MPSVTVRRECLALVIAAAKKYEIPPAYVTAHVRPVKAVAARREVMVQMLEMGLTRSQVAMAFGRDLRRVRASEIGSAGKPGKPEFRRRDYRKVDLFGAPLPEPKRRPQRNHRCELQEAMSLLATLLPDHPKVAEWRQRNSHRR